MAGSKPCTPSPFNSALLATTVVFVCLATVAVLLRLLATHNADGRAWHRTDTWLVIASLVLCYGFMIQTICGCAITGVNCFHSGLDPTWAEHEATKVLWADMFLLVPASALVKISVLEYYKRIFLTKRCWWFCNVTAFLCSVWAISTVFAQGFSSTPISKSWSPDATSDDFNYNYSDFALAVFGINIVLDFVILYMPLPFIFKLHMPTVRLVKLCMVFVIGSFCLVCSAVRFYYADRQLTYTGGNKADRARNAGYAAMWGRMEAAISIVAACLPTLGPLICARYSIFDIASSIFSTRSSRNNSKVLQPDDHPAPSVKVNRSSSATITRHNAFDDPNNPHHHVSIHSASRPTSRVAVPGQISVEYEFSVNTGPSRETSRERVFDDEELEEEDEDDEDEDEDKEPKRERATI